MTEQETINYWLKTATDDLQTAESLFASKRYHHCLFFCHLFTEKILKAAFIAKKHTAPPWTHDLIKLAERAGIPISPQVVEDLREISRFNIAARYDDYKLAFYKKATREFAKKYFSRAKEICQWLKNQF